MNKIIIILLLFPLFAFAQFEEHNLVLKDSLALKNYNQGYLDSQEYFIATNDYLVGLISGPVYYIPAILSYVVTPKRRRLENNYNPNNKYLNLNNDYYNGYMSGAKRKKQKRIVQGALTPLAVVGAVLITVLSTSSY
tara:strand:- start:153 stop:563 length:411 start_codon:yes stop_codon:yes gene_type:complete